MTLSSSPLTHSKSISSDDNANCRSHNFITIFSLLSGIETSLLLLSRDSTLLLHTLATRESASHLFNLAVAIGSGVAVCRCGLHSVDAALLVGLGALLPCCVAGYAANDTLRGLY